MHRLPMPGASPSGDMIVLGVENRGWIATVRDYAVGTAVLVTMVAWMISQSIPAEIRWCGSAHVWSRFA